ncbi:hypothetical protein [Mesorhizobium sp. M2A.F.Ca.ET.017.03.2.1]|uniref:hypothetical protein n=1 Tax=Mesorhizobium sp. M2A.F.Ca.ET.017.03.2.1 TaxID=2496650 RepID=UPI001678DD9A|nr:hypothetical protein [Mesorhizobium sp. M2A.F.Ca.ET.017.03.2.1]
MLTSDKFFLSASLSSLRTASLSSAIWRSVTASFNCPLSLVISAEASPLSVETLSRRDCSSCISARKPRISAWLRANSAALSLSAIRAASAVSASLAWVASSAFCSRVSSFSWLPI